MITNFNARRIESRLVLVPILAVWFLVVDSAVGQDGNGASGEGSASPATTTQPVSRVRRYSSMNDALRSRAAASRPATPGVHQPGTISPSNPQNNGTPTPLDIEIKSEARHIEAVDEVQLEALGASIKASTQPSGPPNRPALPPRVPPRKPPAPGEAAPTTDTVPPTVPPATVGEPEPTPEPVTPEPEGQDTQFDEPMVEEAVPAPAGGPAPSPAPTPGAAPPHTVPPRPVTGTPTTGPARVPPTGSRRPGVTPGVRPGGAPVPQPTSPTTPTAVTDPNAGMTAPKLDPKTYWKLPYNERPYFFNWSNTPLEKCCQDFVEMSGLSMVGLLSEGVNDADRKKPITFQSLELQTFDQALTRFNLITQEVGMGYWTMVRDGYLEFRQLSEWYRRMPAERLYDSEEAYAKAKLPEWEMASMMYTPKHQPAVRLAQWVNDSVPDNCARATLFPDSSWIEIRGCVYHINRALEILAKRDVELKDGREWRVYQLKHRTPAEASSQLQGMLLPEGLMGGSTGAVPANPAPVPQPQSGGPPGGRPGRSSGPVRAPAGPVEIGTGTSDDIEIQEPLSGSSLLVLASPAKHQRIEELLTKYIDVEGSDPRKKEIIELQHVAPSEMIDLISPFLGEPKMVQQPAPPPKPGQPPTPPPPPQIMKVNTSATLTPRPPRSILVEANDKEMREIKELIALLDVPIEESKYQVVKLKHADASSVAMVLTSIITGRQTSPTSYRRPGMPVSSVGGAEGFKAIPDNTTDRTLVLSGNQQDIAEAKELIKQLDVDPAEGAAEHIVQLKNAEPGSVVQILTTRFGGSSSGGGYRRGPYGYGGYGGGGGGGQSLPQFVPDDESKMLVVICHDAMWPDIEKLIVELDDKSETLKTTRSYQLKHANAESVSMLLSQALGSGGRSSYYPRYGMGGGGEGRQPSFLVNTSTNLLLVTALEEDHVKAAELIEKLDQPSPAEQAEFRPIELEQADAEYVAEKIEEVLGGEGGSSRRRSYRSYDYSYSGSYGSSSEGAPKVPVRVIAETISNRVLVSASDEDFKKAETLAKEIDAQYIKQEIIRKTFILENTDAWEAQQIISSMFDAQSSGGGRGRSGYGESYYDRGSSSSTPGSVKIAPMGNGLVVQAPKDKMAEIEKFIAEIDRNPTAGNEVKMYKVKSPGYEGSAGVARNICAMLGIQDTSSRWGPSSSTKSPIKIMGEYGSNVLLVSAPKEKMPEIDKQVQAYIDAQGGDTTMILKHFEVTKARPQEVADIIQPILDTKYREMQESSGGRRGGYYPWFSSSSSSGPQISVNKITRKLMVMAPAELMATVEGLIREFDQASQASVTRTVTLKTAKAEEIAPIVQEHMKASAGPSTGRSRFRSWDGGFGDYSPWSSFRRSSSSSEGSEDLVVTAFEAGNSIILRGTEDKVFEAEQFIKMLDAGAQPEGPMIRVFQLKFADPYEVADYIDEVTGGGDSTSLTSTTVRRVSSSSSSAISVKTDYATRRLIVAAPPEKFPLIEQVIEIQERLAGELAARPTPTGDEPIMNEDGTMTKFYTVEGPAKEIAKRLDEILYGIYGYKGPWVKYSPYTNQVIIESEPKYFKAAEEWLAKLEKNPPPVAMKVLVRRSTVAPSKVLPHLERIVTTSLREGAGIRKLEGSGVGRDPMSMLEEIYYDTPIEEPKPTTRPASTRPAGAQPNIDVVSQFVPTGVLARIERELAAIPLAQISVISRNAATKPAVAPTATRPAAGPTVATRPSQVKPQPPAQPSGDRRVEETRTAAPRTVPGHGGESDSAPVHRVSGQQPGLGHPADAASRDEMTAEERQTAELFQAAAQYRMSNKPQILYDEVQGTFIIFGSEDEVEEIDDILDMIIKEIGEIEEGAKGDIRVFRVKHIDVQVAASMLEAMFNEPTRAQQAPKPQARKPQTPAKPGDKNAKPGEGEEEEPGAQRRREEEEQAKAKEAEEAAAAAASGNIKVVPDPRTSTLIIRAAQESFPKIAELLLKIDRPGPDKVQNIKIFQLKKLNAAEVEEVLKEILKIETPQQRRTFRPRLPGRSGAGVDVDMIEALEQQMLEFQQSMIESSTPSAEGEGKNGKTKINPAKEISIASNATTNTIIVTAPEEGMKLVETLINKLEEQDIPIAIETVELQHAEAEKVATQLQGVFETTQRRGGTGGMRGGMDGYTPSRMGDFKVAADSRTNRLVIRALETDMERILKIVEELDSTPSNPVEIYAVEKASAEDMAKTLTEIYGTQGAGVGGAQTVRITADRNTNSVLVRAPKAQQLLIAAKIKEIEKQSVIQGEVRQIQLKVATPSAIATQLTQIFSSKSSARGTRQQINIVGEDASRMLFVTCPPEMFAEIQKIAEQMDKTTEQTVQVKALQYAAATDILPKLNEMAAKLIAATGLRGSSDAVFAATADERTNSLVIVGSPKAIMVVESVVTQLDVKPSDTTAQTTKMFPLNRGNAASVSATINQLFGSKRWQSGVEAPKASPDTVANVVFVTGTAGQLQLIDEQIIKPLEGYTQVRPVEVAVNDYEIQVNYADVEELATRLTTMFTQGIQARKAAGDTSLTPLETAMSIVPEPSTRKLFVSCSVENKKKLDNWLKGLDIEGASTEGQQTKVLPVRFADLGYASNALATAFRKSGRVPASEQVTILPEYGTNTIIVKAVKKDIEKVEKLLTDIDRDDRERMIAPEALAVKHVLPTQLANRLTAMIKASYAIDKRTGQYPVSVEPNDTAGTLLVTAKNKPAMDSIKELIAKLDSQPAEDLRLTKPYILKFADLGSTQMMITKRFGKQDQLPVRDQVVVDVDYSTGALVVTASEENHKKVGDIIADLDDAVLEDPKMPETIKVKNVRASILAKTLTEMIAQTMKPNRLTRQYPVTVQSNDTANTLVMTANKADMERFKKIISELDVAPDVADTRAIKPYMLKFSDPSVVTKAITDQFAGQEQRPLLEQVTAGPDYTTNSVFVTASEENHKKVQAIIDALDQSDAAGRKTYTVDLKNADPEDVAQTLTTVYNSGPRTRTGRLPAVFTPVPGARKLMVTCTPGELEQAQAMIEQLDVSPEDSGVKRAMRVVPVKKLPAREMMQMLTEYLRKPGKSGSRDPSLQDDIKVTASDTADAVVLSGPEERLDELQQLIEKVDGSVVDPSDPSAGGRQYAVIPLTNADPSSVAMVISQTYQARGNVPDSEKVNAVAERATNSVVVSASAEKLEIIRKMIDELDQQSTNVPQQEIIRLKNARAEDILEVLQQTYQMGRRGMSSSGPPITFAADSNGNSLVVSAGKADMEGIKIMVGELDKPATDNVEDFRIIPLQFVDADETLTILSEYLRKPGTTAGRRGAGTDLIGGIRLQASPTLNALIASGSKDELDRVQKLAQGMDEEVRGAGAPKIIPVKNAAAATLAGTLKELFVNPSQSGGGRRTSQDDVPLIMSDDATNSLIVRARPVDFNLIEDMVKELDRQTEGPSGIEVIPVGRGVDVVELARQIQDVINRGETAKKKSQQAYVPREVAVVGEERSSTLIVSGSKELFDTVKKLAADLEQKRPETGGRRALVVPVKTKSAQDIQKVIEAYIEQQNGRTQRRR